MEKYKISIIGLGYVGLPLAASLSKYFEVSGFDISNERIEELKKKFDRNKEVKSSLLHDINFDNIKNLKKNYFDIFIITVPTPVYPNKKPDLNCLISACEAVAIAMKKKSIVIIESTVAPGMTNGICAKILSKYSKIKNIKNNLAFSPERANPGDQKNILKNVTKVISSNNNKTLKIIKNVYSKIVKKIHNASSIEEAELAKIVENTQRDINIAYINEIMKISEIYKLDYRKLIKTCSTKWNFIKFKPGLVGGHCIPVDPYYLIDDLKKKKIQSFIIKNSRKFNESFVDFIVKKINSYLTIKNFKKVIFTGLSFKDNVIDIRNSKYLEIFNKIKYKKKIFVLSGENKEIKSINKINSISEHKFDAIIVGSYNDYSKKILNYINKNYKKITIIKIFGDINFKNKKNFKIILI